MMFIIYYGLRDCLLQVLNIPIGFLIIQSCAVAFGFMFTSRMSGASFHISTATILDDFLITSYILENIDVS